MASGTASKLVEPNACEELPLHLHVVVVVFVGKGIELGKVSDRDLVRPDETSPQRARLEVALPFDSVGREER